MDEVIIYVPLIVMLVTLYFAGRLVMSNQNIAFVVIGYLISYLTLYFFRKIDGLFGAEPIFLGFVISPIIYSTVFFIARTALHSERIDTKQSLPKTKQPPTELRDQVRVTSQWSPIIIAAIIQAAASIIAALIVIAFGK